VPKPAAATEPFSRPTGAFLFEISWEVCHQVGGIYQVLRSKARAMRARWDDRYVLVGPLVPGMVAVELEPEPADDWLGDVLKTLEGGGVRLLHGRWLVSGRPRAILLEHHLPPERIEVIRHRMQRDHGIPPDRGNELVDGVLGFAEVVRSLFEAAAQHADAPRLVAHFHEWLGSGALPPIRKQDLPVATLFTTHATSVGRYVASSGQDLYEGLAALDGDREAERFGIGTQHAIELRCARDAHVFTTVSPITGEECEHLLGRAPDLVTPNGLDLERFDVGADSQSQHAQFKEQIHRFVMGHFFPSYAFDLDQTLYFFSSGRFEPHNKGFDLCLEAMARLNAELREAGSPTTVVFFIVTSRSTHSLEPRALHARGILDDLEEASARIGRDVAERLFRVSAAGARPSLDELVDDYWRLRHRRLQHAFSSSESPLLCSHVLDDPEHDPILGHLRHLGLSNAPQDRVKIVYHPEFISPVNPLCHHERPRRLRPLRRGRLPGP
jgi:glycogen(starch) synthase